VSDLHFAALRAAALLTGYGNGQAVLGDRLYKSSAVAEMADRLATIDIGRKVGMLCSIRGGSFGSSVIAGHELPTCQ